MRLYHGSNVDIKETTNQYSFHTDRAIRLLNKVEE